MAPPHDILHHAADHLRSGRPGEAERLCRPLLDAHPDLAAAAYLLALARRGQDDAGAAVALLRRAVALAPALDGAILQLGLLLRDRGDARAAAPILRRAVRLAPREPEAVLALAVVRYVLGDLEEAEAGLRRVLELAPGHPGARFQWGVLRNAQGEPAAAVAAYRAVLALHPGLFEAMMNLADLLWHRRAVEPAVALYRRAGVLRPGASLPRVRRGLTLLTGGRPEEAAAALREGLALTPADAEAQGGLERARRYRALTRAAEDGAAPPGLAVRGTFRDSSGYAHMVRRFTRQLVEDGTRVNLIDARFSNGVVLKRGLRDRLFETLDRPVRARALLSFTTPQTAEPVPGLGRVLFSMFEGRRIPEDWLPYSRAQDLLIVPTESSRRAWIAGGLPEDRIRLCPLGVEPVAVPAGPPPVTMTGRGGRPLAECRTRILNISDFASRKNLDGLLRVWMRATTAADDAVLIIKPGKELRQGDPIFARFIDHVARSVGRRPEEAAPVMVVYGHYSDAAMLSLFATATHYWSMSHGEGWDLPMTQAGAMGLRLIAPDHSAYRTYLDPTVASLIPSRETAATDGYGQVPIPNYYPPLWLCRGQEWWSPDEEAAADLVARAVRGEDPPLSARGRLVESYGWPAAARRLSAILRDAGMLDG